ncbi:MAG: DUF3307 domain-containing protein [Caldilineaceae bacterium]
MTTFTWLLVAHLVGDWMLQNDWMARAKQSSLFNRAIAVHCLIYTLTVLVSLWLAAFKHSLQPAYVHVSLFILVSHWLIDAAGLAKRWARLFRQSNTSFVHIMVDQTMHVVILAWVAEFLL